MPTKLFIRANAVYEASEKQTQDEVEITDAVTTDGGGRILSIDFSGDGGGGLTEQQVLDLIANNIPTLAQVLEAGNDADHIDISGLGSLEASPLEVNGIRFSSPIDMNGGDLVGVNNINGDPYPPA